METLLARLQPGQIASHSGKLAILMLQEDTVSSVRAQEFVSALRGQLPCPTHAITRAWFFNELKMPRLRKIAADEAGTADVILISMRHADGLPEEVQAWIEAWKPLRHGRKGTLIALLDPLYSGDSSSLEAHLEQVASQAKLTFLSHAEDLPEDRALP